MTGLDDFSPSMIERIERALVLLACFIEVDGDVHLPMYEKLEAELADLRRKDATRDRARRLLLSHGGRLPMEHIGAGASGGRLGESALPIMRALPRPDTRP